MFDIGKASNDIGKHSGTGRMVFAIVLVFVVALSFVIFTLRPRLPEVRVPIQDGVVDLSLVDFEASIARLPLTWDYYPGELYEPADFSAGRVGEPRQFSSGDEQTYRTGTYHVTLKVTPGQTYTMNGWSLGYATRIYLNGQSALNVGRVTPTAEDFSPQIANYTLPIFPQSQEVDIIIQYANFSHDQGGKMTDIVFGLPDNVNSYAQISFYSASMLGGALLIVAVFYLMLFIGGRGFPNFAFAMCCWFLATGNQQYLISLMPLEFPWDLIYRYVFYCSPGTGMAILVLTFSMYPNLLPKRFARVTVFATVGFMVALIPIAIFVPLAVVERLLIPSYIIEIPAYVCICWTFVKLYVKGRDTDRITAFGITVLFGSLVVEAILQRPVPEVTRIGLGPFGMVAFVICQMLALGIEKETLDRLNRMKTEFLQNMGHEMKTPLAVINGYLELSLDREKQRPSPDDRIIVNLTRALAEGNRAGHMARQLLDVAETEGRLKPRFERVDLEALIGSVRDTYFAMLNKNYNTLRLSIAEDLPPVRADSELISRVMVNLIQNAVRFTRNGVITVSAQTIDDFVEVSVADTGSGIPSEMASQLFQRFGTGETSTGTGLGLYICKQTIEAHGGSIDIASEPDQGTKIRFTLPFWKEEADESGHDSTGRR